MPEFSIQFHLLGVLSHERHLALQRRLVYDVSGQADGRIVVLFCEHPRSITVGRRGSRGFIRLSSEELRSRRLEVHWVSRGGGCVLHAPGQLAIYPIVPLSWHRWTVGELLRRLRRGMKETLSELKIQSADFTDSFGVGGRSGQLATVGIAVRNWVSCYGAFLNVNPAMADHAFVDVIDPSKSPEGRKTTMGSILAERRRAVTIQKVRSMLIPNLASAFGTDHYNILTGHPLLPLSRQLESRNRHRAS